MQTVKLIVYPVSDLTKAKEVFGKFLGVAPYVDSPYYVGYKTGDLEIGLNPNAVKQGITAPVTYVEVDDIRERLRMMTDTGARVVQDVRDVGGGLLVASVKDADGNILGFRQQSS